jgi:hypothetical protein
MWLFLVCYAELCDPVYVYNGFSSKKYVKMYRTLYSYQWIPENNFEELFDPASSDQKPRRTSKKNTNMCRDFFGKITSPILMHPEKLDRSR